VKLASRPVGYPRSGTWLPNPQSRRDANGAPQLLALDVHFLCLPWAPLELPSAAISLLSPIVERHDAANKVTARYLNIDWADYLHDRSQARWNAEEYEDIVGGYFVGLGDWIFSSYFRPSVEPESSAYFRMVERSGGQIAEHALDMYRYAADFINRQADKLATGLETSLQPVIGFTTTFDQNMASLALAHAIKQRRPDAITLFGGANCDGPQGPALHRNFRFIDYVISGEAETSLPLLLTEIGQGRHLSGRVAAIPGLSRWHFDGSVSTPAAKELAPLQNQDRPDLTAFYARFETSNVLRGRVTPKMQLEGSRGCWWGQKHHCTFCGLNGTGMKFRARTPEDFVDQLRDMSIANKSLDAVFTDNILDMRVVEDAAARLAAMDLDLQLFAEVKSNLKFGQLSRMSGAGFTQLQPGIESLLNPVLRLMRKGVRAWQNIRFLRDAATVGIYPGWNMLFGFPGEEEGDYRALMSVLPNIYHLVPPEGTYRIVLTRFSPYFEDHSLGLVKRGPSALVSAAYGLPKREMADLVYVYDSVPAGISQTLAEELEAASEDWKRRHHESRLHIATPNPPYDIIDRRNGRNLLYSLDAEESALLMRGARGVDVKSLSSREFAILQQFEHSGLVFRDEDTGVSLPIGLTW
jgi:ribosomal peptide maturation radical SAM protein 1